MIDIPVAPLATQVILEAYLQVLEVCVYVIHFVAVLIYVLQAASECDLIAMYPGALRITPSRDTPCS